MMSGHRSEFRSPPAGSGGRVLLPVAALVALAALGAGAAAPPIRLPLASGRVIYQVQHPMARGTSTVVWTEHGRRFRQDTVLTRANPVPSAMGAMEYRTWIIGDPEFAYVYAPSMGRLVQRVPIREINENLAPGSVPLGPATGKLLGRETLLGKPCEIRQVGEYRLWMWRQLPLRAETASRQLPRSAAVGPVLAQGLKVVATKLEPGYKPRPGAFKVDVSYTVADFKLPQRGVISTSPEVR
jgi:hypothetical protein